MPFCLLTEAWLPARRASGRLCWIAPAQIAGSASDPVVSLEWPRPDFQLAGLEFLIGLLATTMAPEDHDAWCDFYNAPPSEADLAAQFAPFAPAFMLDGDGPRFMQDSEDFEVESNDAGALLIEAPGENTIKRNTDLLVKRGQVEQLGRAAAAMALFTLQNYAPSGGAGNRTSLRGGGPLTTLAIPPRRSSQGSLWDQIWANVPCGEPAAQTDWPMVFPWLAPTRLSDKTGRITTPVDAPPHLVWWATPRRIRLDFGANGNSDTCDLTGQIDSVIVTSWRQRPWGANYQNWLHPLSPYYQGTGDAGWLPVHPQPGGINYQHWAGLLFADAAPGRKIAATIETFRAKRARAIGRSKEPWRLLAGGFDMDNMKARGFVESEMPVYEPADPKAAHMHDQFLTLLINAAAEVAKLLGRAVSRALYGEKSDVKFDASPLSALRERFWTETEAEFYARAAGPKLDLEDEASRKSWLRYIGKEALRLFHEAAPVDASGEGHPDRIAAAAKHLGLVLSGYGKDGEALFKALMLPAPEKSVTRKKEKAA
jgi:CRISPR system Cascade subunit CasA